MVQLYLIIKFELMTHDSGTTDPQAIAWDSALFISFLDWLSFFLASYVFHFPSIYS